MAFTCSDLPGSASLVESLGTRCDDLIPSSLFYYAVYFSNVNYVKGLTCRFPSGNLAGSLFSLQSTFSAANAARVEIPILTNPYPCWIGIPTQELKSCPKPELRRRSWQSWWRRRRGRRFGSFRH